MSNVLALAHPQARNARPQVLHVGCGHLSPHRLHAVFRENWREIRLDIDETVKPDLVCSTADMSRVVASGSVDAVWSSHTVEHLYDHEVTTAFAEFRRVLDPAGFCLLRCPDLGAIAESLLHHGVEHVAYESPAGPVTPLDMLYGHRPSIAGGRETMAHRTGFTEERIGRALIAAGFDEVRTRRAPTFDLWALAFMPRARVNDRLAQLSRAGLSFDS